MYVEGLAFWNATSAFPSMTPFAQDLLAALASHQVTQLCIELSLPLYFYEVGVSSVSTVLQAVSSRNMLVISFIFGCV